MKPEDLNDPKKNFSGVRQQPGAVQRDSDWNKKRGPRRGVMILGAGALVAVLAAVIAAGWLFLRARTMPDINQASFAAVSLPQDGAIVPLHDRHTVVAEAFSAAGVRELQLWVNDQQWGTIAPDPARDRVTQTWAWTPSSEGEHHLVARLVSADGSVTESALVRVYASGAFDVRFPVNYETRQGDTAGAIARQFGSDLQDLLDSNRGLDPSSPLPAGLDVTVPIPVGGTEPSLTDYGEPAAPPAGGVTVPVGSSAGQIVDGVHQAQAGDGPVLWRAFELLDGKLKPNEPVDLLYLYLSVNGEDWGRFPEDPQDYLHPSGGVFDLTSHLKKVAAQAGGGPVQIHAEVWGWRNGALTYLGSYFGEITTDGGGLQTTASGATQLRLIDFVYLGKESYKQWAVLTGDDPDLREDFRWTTTLPGVTYAMWQISDKPFPAGVILNPSGLVHQGLSTGYGGKFTVDFADYFWGSGGGGGGFGGLGGGFDFPNSLEDLLGGKSDPLQQFNPWLAKAFFIRAIPMKGQAFPGIPGVVAGPPSAAMTILYTPTGTPYSPKAPPSGPVYEARVVGFQFYREADPDYAACWVMNYDYQSCSTVNGQKQCHTVMPKGSLSCGCPGVSCSGSSSSCGEFSLNGVSDCLQEGAGALGSALGSLASWGASVYNGAVDFVKDAISSVACGGLSGDAKKACEAGVGIAVNVGLASLGLPPEIPDFEKLMNEGLDYALAVAAQELTAQLGFECDKTCQDLIKAGIEGMKDPDKLFDDGLAFAVDRAKAELEDLGVNCDAKCQGLIGQAAQGDLSASVLFNAGLDQAAAEAAASLNANGYPCNTACKNAILQGMNDSRSLMVSASNAASAKPPPPLYVPHPLSVRQPAVVTVEIFRRFESAGIPEEDINACGLSLFTSESTNLAGSQFSFSPFFGKGIELPAIDPGETIQVPIALERKFNDITPAMIQAALAELQAKGIVVAGLVDATGTPVGATTESGVVSGGTLTAWYELYHGGVLQIKLTGPAFLTVVDGSAKGLPCVAEETWSTGIPAP